jgi:peptide-methionine (S)-S-oxide reductase
MEKATFAVGGFGAAEAAFRALAGVREVRAGSMGGTLEEPTYEAVEVEFDPWKVSYDDLLEVFWAEHDPALHGSAIFPHTVEQHVAADESVKRVQKRRGLDHPVATAIVPASRFWPATER